MSPSPSIVALNDKKLASFFWPVHPSLTLMELSSERTGALEYVSVLRSRLDERHSAAARAPDGPRTGPGRAPNGPWTGPGKKGQHSAGDPE